VSTSPPDDPWGSGSGSSPPPPPPGGYPPPPPGYPPPPPGGGYPGGGYPTGGYQGGGYPGGGYPGGGYQGGGYPGTKGSTPFGPATGWWQRVGATLVDGLVLIVPNFIVDIIGGRGFGTVLSFILSATYVTLMLSRRGQTVGNMAVGTRVVDARTGGLVSPGKAFGRYVSELIMTILLIVPVILDFLWPLWDGQNQTLHDKIAGTFVIRSQ
jgi:uncharacterized RDD family membrane protein YckC